MILIDLSQISYACFLAQIQGNKDVIIEEDLIRHMILNQIKNINVKFGQKYGELVIAADSYSWRYEAFPYYKASRKKIKDESGIDFNKLHKIINMIGQELNENFPYRFIKVDGAEGDDIIGTLCRTYGCKFPIEDSPFFREEKIEKILIISGDKDFPQLQLYTNIFQYDPIHKKDFIKVEEPITYLRAHIMNGDITDGIPNFLSSDNCKVIGQRQKPLYDKKVQEWVKQYPNQYCTDEMFMNYERNRKLIDLWCTPIQISNFILQTYKEQENKKSNVFNYLFKYGLNKLMERASDF